MSEEEEAVAIVNIGRLLAKMRWDKATPEQKAAQVKKMLAGRRKKAKRGRK